MVAIKTGDLIEGRLNRTAGRLVREWAFRYNTELMQNWDRSRAGTREPMERIPGLDADGE